MSSNGNWGVAVLDRSPEWRYETGTQVAAIRGAWAVYAIEKGIYEYSFVGGAWVRTAVAGLTEPGSIVHRFGSGDCRGDSRSRVYGFGNTYGRPFILESEFIGSAWQTAVLPYPAGTLAGPFRMMDDGACLYSQPADNALDGLRLRDTDWLRTPIDDEALGATGGRVALGIVAGAGRNDGVDRVYVVESPSFRSNELSVLEYELGRRGWSKTKIATVPSLAGAGASPGWQVLGLLPARGGRNALYLTDDAGNWHEVRFEGDGWRYTLSPAANRATWSGHSRCAGGEGRGDGVYRFYCVGWPGQVAEITHDGSQWTSSASFGVVLSEPEPGMWWLDSVAVGPGRNDGVGRVYIQAHYSGGSQLLELTHRR